MAFRCRGARQTVPFLQGGIPTWGFAPLSIGVPLGLDAVAGAFPSPMF
jgi:hypothetical protein